MRIERSLKIRDEAKRRTREMFSFASHYGMTSEEMNASYAAIISDMGKAPHWVRAYVDGYRQAQMDRLYESLIFGGFVDGKFFSTHSDRRDYYGKAGIDPADWHKAAKAKGHYFDRFVPLATGVYDRGAFKPFFVMEEN